MEALLGMGVATAGGLFDYNRKNYFFDKEQHQKGTYQNFSMSIKRFELYREDVRDLVDLTVKKMDNYLVVNTLQLGFCVTLFVEGRPEIDESEAHANLPQWILWQFSICNVSAFLYYLLSVWLSIHASIAAHSFGVRLLTQFVRLPVPSDLQLDAARAMGTDYEAVGVTEMLRIPLWKKQLNNIKAALDNVNADDPYNEDEIEGNDSPVASLQHIKLFRQLQANWQSYDAYARVSMAMGANLTMQTLCYYVLQMSWKRLKVNDETFPFSGICLVILFSTTAWSLFWLDLYLSRRLLQVSVVLIFAPPILSIVGIILQRYYYSNALGILIPVIYFLHLVWICFTTLAAKPDLINNVALPSKFRSVLFLDVFGWFKPEEEDNLEPALPDAPMPANLDALLRHECSQQNAEIRVDLQFFEGSQVQDYLQDDMVTLKKVAAARTRFDTVSQIFLSLAGERETVNVLPPGWLKLAWNPTGSPLTYYFNCRTGETTWDEPRDKSRICDFVSLEERLASFEAQVRSLSGQSELRKVAGISSSLTSDSGSSASYLAPTHQLAELPPTEGKRGSLLQPLPRTPTSETQTHLLATNNPQAGTTFHPATARAREQSRSRPPGLLPWTTFLTTSVVLMGVWIVGVAWTIAHYSFNIDIHQVIPESSNDFYMPRLLQTDVSATGSPSSRPVGMACHANLTSLLIAERFAVFDFHGSEMTPNEDIAHCLDQNPQFRGLGIKDISVECPNSVCSAVLLGADGATALRCRLVQGFHKNAGTFGLLGGPWQQLALDEDGTSWGLRNQTLAKLHPRALGLMPILELNNMEDVTLTAVHVIPGRSVLGLDEGGRLHSWPSWGGPVRSWRLPPTVHWHDFCTLKDEMFVLGSLAGVMNVWRFALPPAIFITPTNTLPRWLRRLLMNR